MIGQYLVNLPEMQIICNCNIIPQFEVYGQQITPGNTFQGTNVTIDTISKYQGTTSF